jgi:hypothetical protein
MKTLENDHLIDQQGDGRILGEKVLKIRVNGSGYGSCQVVGFGVSGVECLGYVINVFVPYVFAMARCGM